MAGAASFAARRHIDGSGHEGSLCSDERNKHAMHDPRDLGISRRDLLIVGAASIVATAVPPAAKAQAPVAGAPRRVG